MNDPHDLNRTIDIPASEPTDSLDAGLAAGFRRSIVPRFSLGDQRPVLLREAEGESDLIIKPTSDAMPPRELSGDRYQLEGEIARGGMGVVLRGRDVDLGRDIAVKVLLEKHRHRPDVARRFVEEAQIGGQLQHPGIVPVYDIGRFGDRPFFAMKLVKGQTLATLLEGRLDPSHDLPRFLAIALQVFQTMAYAHAKGVIHRDLKPANIMVGAFGEVQVMDWGLAKVLQEGGIADEERASRHHRQAKDVSTIRTLRSHGSSGSGSQTEMGSLLGTPAYMPPEQANGDVALLDRRCDVFGLGAILCEILTGKPPYVGRNSEEVRRNAANANLADANARLDASGADADLVALTKKCLAPEPLDRPKDAQAVADILAANLNGVQERLQEAQRESAVAQARAIEERKRRRVQLALAGAVLSLLLGGGAVAWWRNEQVQVGRERDARNAEAVVALLGQGEEALRKNDTSRAAVVLEAASKRSAEGGAGDHLARLQSLQNDLALLKDLDAVDQFRWTIQENKLPNGDIVAERTRQALAHFDLDPGTVTVDKAAARIAASTVRDRIVAALDLLLGQQKKEPVRTLLQRVDADPFRDLVRDAVLVKNQTRMRELAGQPAALEQPPGFAAFMGNSMVVPVERRRELLQSSLRNSPGNLTLLMTLGDTYPIDQKEGAEECVRWYQAAVAASPRNPVAHTDLGYWELERGRLEEAADCFKKAIELDQNYAGAYNNLGLVMQKKGQMEQAIECYKKAIDLGPKLAQPHYNLGLVMQEKGQMNEAIDCFKKAIELKPKFSMAHNNLGLAWKSKGQVDEAIACYKKAIELDPKFSRAHDDLGLALKSKGQVDEAIECYKKAIELDPKYVRAHDNLGNALSSKGKQDEAIASHKKAIELDPKNAAALNNLGLVMQKKGQMDQAIACFKKAIELDPKEAKAYSNLGGALNKMGCLNEAIESVKKAIEIDPKHPGAHNNLGVTLKGMGRLNEAIEYFIKAIELDPKDTIALSNLGSALKDKGQEGQAIDCFQMAIKHDPRNAMYYIDLCDLLINRADPKLRNPKEAVVLARKATELEPRNWIAWGNLGEALYRTGEFQQAIANLDKGLALYKTDDCETFFYLAMAHYQSGNREEARMWYDKGVALMKKVKVQSKEAGLQRLRGEAAEVLRVK